MSKTVVYRFKPHQDLKKALSELAIDSGSIISAVGSVSLMCVRVADGKSIEEHHENMEVISFSGTLTKGHIHAHIAAINGKMNVFGGHLMDGCIVNTTMEIVILDFSDEYDNRRENDLQTGYDELVVIKR